MKNGKVKDRCAPPEGSAGARRQEQQRQPEEGRGSRGTSPHSREMRATRETSGRDASLGTLSKSARGSRARSDSLEEPRAAFAATAGRGGSLEARSWARGDQSGATRNECSSMSVREGIRGSGWQAKQPPSDSACSRPIKSLMAVDVVSGGPQSSVLSGSGARGRERGTEIIIVIRRNVVPSA